MNELKKISLFNVELENGKRLGYLPLSYQCFGPALSTAPVVLVNHALTGNSNVAGENGWWKELIGENKSIDTSHFTVIAFNIPGNGYDGNDENLIFSYQDFTIRDIAGIFWEGLQLLKIPTLHAVIGGSLGGAIAWEMVVLQPHRIAHLIPIATDWKATDWMIGNVLVQQRILNHSEHPIADARLHAMLLYRTPQSVNRRFGGKRNDDSSPYQIEQWLDYHGDSLKQRFTLAAYKLMNHLLKTNNITRNRSSFTTVISRVSANIHIVAVDTDYFFTADENRLTYQDLRTIRDNDSYHEIRSIHGHDAFLMEHEQLNKILKPFFTTKKQYNESN